jgi:cytochrome c peroxidase
MMIRLASVVVALLVSAAAGGAAAAALSPEEQLGRFIFFDETLSLNRNQSCATCHAPEAGWTGPESAINAAGAVYEGSQRGRFTERKPPSSAYATQSPVLRHDKAEGTFVGGNFWDGRATGRALGSPAADQARGPFLNPLEHALASPADVIERVCAASYGALFRKVWGEAACDLRSAQAGFNKVARSLAAFEASAESSAFSSRYDEALRGRAVLTREEQQGRTLFMGKGKCQQCHPASGENPLFTDYSFDNLGLPRNPDNPFYQADSEDNALGRDWVDRGLGGFLEMEPNYQQAAAANIGKHKVPTLRNVAKDSCEAEPANPGCIVKAYGHNGFFKSLKAFVHFYNTRDVKPRCADAWTPEALALEQNCWPAPEVEANMNMAEIGDLGLTPTEEAAIVAFLKTLSDAGPAKEEQTHGRKSAR